MPILADLLEHSAGLAAQGHAEGMRNIQTAAQNLTQGLGVVHDLGIQAQSSVADDPTTIAGLQTASRTPIQGSNDLAK